LAVRVVPRAGKTAVTGPRGNAVVVRVAAPPVEGAANEAVIDALADVLGLPRRALTILRGQTGRDKLIAIDGLSASAVSSRLEAFLQTG
jgi:uncharacterized protein (TIGR00251 family)